MKKIVFIFGLVVLAMPFLASAQTGNATGSPALPNITITPDNPFYFLVSWKEGIQEFFTFNQEAKARLQVDFAAKRIAEIQALLEKNGVTAKGLDVAESRLRNHLSEAGDIIKSLKSKGENAGDLSKELSDEVKSSASVLGDTFNNQIQNTEDKLKSFGQQLNDAVKSDDTVKEETIKNQINQLKTDKTELENKQSDLEDEINTEEDDIGVGLGPQQRAQEAIKNDDEEKQNLLSHAAESGFQPAVSTFAAFDSLLGQAKDAFGAGKYDDAFNLAKEARHYLEDAKSSLEETQHNQEMKNEENEQQLRTKSEEGQRTGDEATSTEMNGQKFEGSDNQKDSGGPNGGGSDGGGADNEAD